MTMVFWIVTALVALIFLAGGLMKLIQSKEKLEPLMNWVADMKMSTVRTIGLLEVLGATGLVLPRLTNVLPWLSVAVAAGLTLTVSAGAIVHLRRGDGVSAITPNIVIAALSVVAFFGAFNDSGLANMQSSKNRDSTRSPGTTIVSLRSNLYSTFSATCNVTCIPSSSTFRLHCCF